MGIFSGIKKAFKKVVRGVKKVFKKVGKFVGKIVNSKWGKALMLAAAVVTGGMAIAAGVQGFAGSTATSFLGKFVAGAKEFVTVLATPVKSAKNLLGGQPLTEGLAAQAANVVPTVGEAAGQAATGTAGQVATTAAEQLGQGASAGLTKTAGEVAAGQAATGAAGQAATTAAGEAAKKGILGHAKDVLMSSGGGAVVGGLIKGYGEGAAAEEAIKREDYYRGAFTPEQYEGLQGAVGGVQFPQAARGQGYLSQARHTYQPGRPEDVYGSYVTGQPAGG